MEDLDLVMGNICQDSFLEGRDFLVCQGVGFGNDWNQVDLFVKTTHELNVDWTKTRRGMRKGRIRVGRKRGGSVKMEGK